MGRSKPGSPDGAANALAHQSMSETYQCFISPAPCSRAGRPAPDHGRQQIAYWAVCCPATYWRTEDVQQIVVKSRLTDPKPRAERISDCLRARRAR